VRGKEAVACPGPWVPERWIPGDPLGAGRVFQVLVAPSNFVPRCSIGSLPANCADSREIDTTGPAYDGGSGVGVGSSPREMSPLSSIDDINL
jgi:hypothetical protein